MTVSARALASAAGTTVVNEVSGVHGDQPDPDPANNTAEAKTVVAESADLALVKSAAPSPVDAGQPLTYTLVVANAGPSTAQNVILRDPLPVGVTPKSAATSAGTCTIGTTVNCSLGSVASGGNVTVKLIVAVDPSLAATGLTNTATVTSATGDPNPLNNTASVTTAVEGSADLSLVKHGPPTALAGEQGQLHLDGQQRRPVRRPGRRGPGPVAGGRDFCVGFTLAGVVRRERGHNVPPRRTGCGRQRHDRPCRRAPAGDSR